MEVNAKLRFARIAPRKMRLVARAVRGLPWPAAEVRLRILEPRSAPILLKLLRSAVANAQHNFNLDPQQLRISRILVNEGPRLKRWMPRARGSAGRILKRTSHVEVVVSDGREPHSAEAPRGAPAARKTAIETKKVEELTAEELKEARKRPAPGGKPQREGAVKPADAPRGLRPLIERKHGGE